MALPGYPRLCPKSGHVLTKDELDALRARRVADAGALAVDCTACGRVVETRMDPGKAWSLVYPMHVCGVADLGPDEGPALR
jgi:hypothetical protein